MRGRAAAVPVLCALAACGGSDGQDDDPAAPSAGSTAEVEQLGPIPVGAGNIGALVDTVSLPPGTVLNGQHALIIKGQNAGPATPPLACAGLPERGRLPPSA